MRALSPRATKRVRRPASNLVHGFTSPATIDEQGPIILVRAKGAYVWDEHGKRYLDGLASLWNVAVGHGRPEIARAVAQQTRRLSYAPTLLNFSSEPAERLATRIAQLAPGDLNRVLFTSGGSDANESVIRLVRLYWRLRQRPDKIKMVALNRAYHGSSTGAASLTGLPNFHQYYEPMMPGVVRMVRPHCYRCELGLRYPDCAIACADELERIIARDGADTIGAFIAEPVQGVGGVIPPPDGYWQRVRAICDRHEVLMIADEVITGFGRLGRPFAMERFGVVPDMIVFAKGVTSGYLPLGGVIMREPVYRTLVEAGPTFALHHGFTYSGHPVVCAAGLANLDIMEREKLFARVRKLEPYFRRRLRHLVHHAIVGDVRAIGLMAAIDFVRDRDTKEPFAAELDVGPRVRRACLDHGVIVRASGDTIAICPPLIITAAQIDALVAALDAAIAAVSAELADTASGPMEGGAPSPPGGGMGWVASD